jgi:asparagine synthase (glutamine-hydrolysing)
MCGISGIIGNLNGRQEAVGKMNDAISYRGPDDSGITVFENCILGHRRLSIVDLCSGHQPIVSADGAKTVVFNGEIYGYKDLRKTITNYPFKTDSDTEVILALYEQHGNEFVKFLPGMFSLAIWNETTRELICCRDRFGEKPFYYAVLPNGAFLFASEIKALLASELIDTSIDTDSIAYYLQHLYVHPHTTVYKSIKVLPPAHYLVHKQGKTEIKRYWNLPAERQDLDLNTAAEIFGSLFKQSVKKQLIADVPVGCFLSGGIDSSLVVAAAAEHSDKITTLSFGFGDQINELPYAKLVAEKYRTNHIEIQQPLPNLADLLIEMQHVYDEPFADSSNIPTYLISKAAAKEVKVVLTGDGGDELLGGYSSWYRHLVNMEKTKLMSSPSRFILSYCSRIARKLGNNYVPFLQTQQLVLAHTSERAINKIHEAQNIYFTNHQLQELGLSTGNFADPIPYSFKSTGTVSDAMKMDIENYMPGDILVKTDRASMANGLELRAPFLDKDLAEFCISLPYKLKLNYKEEKLVAKKAFEGKLPGAVVKRAKQGFGAPVGYWLQTPALRQLKNEYLENSNRKIFDMLDYRSVQHMSSANNYYTWILLVLSLWLEKSHK